MGNNNNWPLRSLCTFGIGIIVFIFLTFILFTKPLYALLNPSAVYCKALGYTFTTESTSQGMQSKCILADGQSVDAWDFFLGRVAQDMSICARKGYEMVTLSNNKKCIKYMVDECAFCILPDGSREEISNLMKLSFRENYSTCPGDCPSGSWDAYCDMVKDGIVDPDCDEFEDPDEMLLASTIITPQSLDCESEGKWIKAHMIMPAGITEGQVDTQMPAVIENFGIPSEAITVFISEEGQVQADVSFSRDTICAFLGPIDESSIELKVSAKLTNSEFVFGNDIIKLIK